MAKNDNLHKAKDAKNYFSKRNCVVAKMADGYLKGNPIRQELLEKALAWRKKRARLPQKAQ